jgi:hypothetical protein
LRARLKFWACPKAILFGFQLRARAQDLDWNATDVFQTDCISTGGWSNDSGLAVLEPDTDIAVRRDGHRFPLAPDGFGRVDQIASELLVRADK